MGCTERPEEILGVFVFESARMNTKGLVMSTAENRLAAGAGLSEVDPCRYRRLIFKKRGNRAFEESTVSETLLTEEGLARKGRLTWAGLLLLEQRPQKFLPVSYVEFRAYN